MSQQHAMLTMRRNRLHRVIIRELGHSQLHSTLAQLMHGDDIGNRAIHKALDEYNDYLSRHWKSLYPNMSKPNGVS